MRRGQWGKGASLLHTLFALICILSSSAIPRLSRNENMPPSSLRCGEDSYLGHGAECYGPATMGAIIRALASLTNSPTDDRGSPSSRMIT
jgi:hypothetical protein